ncbi:MAG TPA: CoA transferase, partial [Candidatus Limnocylindria bacterium]|nr:CoA transferase [Candidatus Limnocylindria bacterium]
PRDDWLAALRGAGVPCGEIADYDRVLTDEHLAARGYFVDLAHATLGSVRSIGSPLGLTRTPVRLERAGPLLGEHTREVLRAIGCDEAEIERLARDGTVLAAG